MVIFVIYLLAKQICHLGDFEPNRHRIEKKPSPLGCFAGSVSTTLIRSFVNKEQ
jgi:hypothetical protein